MSATPEQRARYNNPEGRFCACGSPAVVVRQNEPICARCVHIESDLYGDKNGWTSNLLTHHTHKRSQAFMPETFAVNLPNWQ